jgi:transporter family-2 protein
MRAYLYLLTVFLGVMLTVHLAMNARVGAAMANPRVGNAFFWCIGAITAIGVGLTGWRTGALAPLSEVNPVLLTAGAIGAMLVFAIAWLIPQIGAGPLTLCLLLGQIVSGMVISHFGWLGSPVQPIAAINLAGALVMIVGVVLATRA